MQETSAGDKKKFIKSIKKPLKISINSDFDDRIPVITGKLSKQQLSELTQNISNIILTFKNPETTTFKPFWDKNKTILSNKIWWPSQKLTSSIIIREQRLNHYNHSWFNITEQKEPIEFNLDTLKIKKSLPFKTPKLSKKNPIGYKTLKVRIFPTNTEKEKLEDIFNQYRWYYNTTVQLFNINYAKLFKNNDITPKKFSFSFIRDKILRRYTYKEANGEGIFSYNEDGKAFPTPIWMKNCHNQVPRGACKKFTSSLNAVITNFNEGNCESPPVMKFMSKKHRTTNYCLFEDKHYPKWLNKIKGRYWYTNEEGKRRIMRLKDISLDRGFEVIHDRAANK
jgi:hypothetical protein